jgi:hypothetical protein
MQVNLFSFVCGGIMSMLENPKLKFLLIIPIILAVLFFATTILESKPPDDTDRREGILTQFAINYESMMTACSKDNLDPDELQSCLNAFDEVREFCLIEDADQCGDEQMVELEQKLLDI